MSTITTKPMGQQASRIFHDNYTLVPDSTWRERIQFVDAFINTLRLVSSGKQADVDVIGGCDGYHRYVEVLPADAADPQRGWIPISPPDGANPPAGMCAIRIYDDVVVIPNPAAGTWKIRTRYHFRSA